MAAAAVTSSMASLSLRGSSFREFHGLVAQPSARPAMPSPAQGNPLKILKDSLFVVSLPAGVKSMRFLSLWSCFL